MMDTDSASDIKRSVMNMMRSLEIPAVTKASVNQSKYVSAVLNSSLGRWFLAHGETLPIPELSAAEQGQFVRIVDRILAAKAADPNADSGALEEEIDWLVYDLYDLNNEETAIVADYFWTGTLTEEEEDKALLKAMLEADLDDRVSLEEVREILRVSDDC